MRVLFDQAAPVPLRKFLDFCTVDTAAEKKWNDLENGDLIQAAEDAGYDLIVTTDQNIKYQQNLTDRKIGIVVLLRPSWPKLQLRAEEIALQIMHASQGCFVEVE